jgi:hypothetical protein
MELIISGDFYFEIMKYTGVSITVIGNGLAIYYRRCFIDELMYFSAASNGSFSYPPLTSLQERPRTRVRVNGPATCQYTKN